MGSDTFDDAGVYKLRDDLALIQTLDFFTPMVDDPYLFGQIAAANALSDVYAMGGTPLTAMNIATFPRCGDLDAFAEILRGGAEKIREAGALLIGGHTVDDKEPKYGLSVTGTAHPDQIWTNSGARPGDTLLLTKKLGNGILATALKGGLLDAAMEAAVAAEMAGLNKRAAEAAQGGQITAVTDITGFGFLGHLGEMAAGSGAAAQVWADQLPLWPEALELAEMGIIPAGAHTNRTYLGDRISFQPGVSQARQDILFDPQTSGGLLIAAGPADLTPLEERLQSAGVPYRLVGRIVAGRSGQIQVLAGRQS